MTERTCIKCKAPVRAERSKIRLTLRCTNNDCNHVAIKNVIKKGHG